MNIFHSFNHFLGLLLKKNIHLINSCSELHSKIVIKNEFIHSNHFLGHLLKKNIHLINNCLELHSKNCK